MTDTAIHENGRAQEATRDTGQGGPETDLLDYNRAAPTWYKVSGRDVAAIRLATGLVRQADLAKRYGVSRGYICRIQRGQRWQSVRFVAPPHRAPDHVGRFMDKVAAEPNTGCWLWLGWVNDDGYGCFTRDGSRRLAHRASYELFVGAIPEGLCVCHTCDVRCCVNPQHLWPGTIAENNADMDAKGRRGGPVGEGNSNARLVVEDVVSVRAAAASGVSQVEIANRFSMSEQAISDIVLRRTWNSVQGAA